MGFDPSVITDVSIAESGSSLTIAWTATTTGPFQVYAGGSNNATRLYAGYGLSCTVPRPDVHTRLTIGAVLPAEISTNFASSLPPAPTPRAVLTWTGGVIEGADLLGFRVYGETTPGGGIDYTKPLADIQAFANGFAPVDASTSKFTWESDPIPTSGTWNWAIKPYDRVGNEGSSSTIAVLLTRLPSEIPRQSDKIRLHYAYTQTTKIVVLSWLASS